MARKRNQNMCKISSAYFNINIFKDARKAIIQKEKIDTVRYLDKFIRQGDYEGT